MQVKAELNNLRIAPRKTRMIVDLIRRKRIDEAKAILSFIRKKGAEPILKLLNSASANATNNFQLDLSNLYISKITVDEGRKLKRWMPRARGRAAEIQKKTSFITLILDEIKPTAFKKAKKAKPSKPAELKTENETKKEKHDFKQNFEINKPKKAGGVVKMFRRKAI